MHSVFELYLPYTWELNAQKAIAATKRSPESGPPP